MYGLLGVIFKDKMLRYYKNPYDDHIGAGGVIMKLNNIKTWIYFLSFISLPAFAAEKVGSENEQYNDLPKLNYTYVAEDPNMVCHLNYQKSQSGKQRVVIEKCVQKNDFLAKVLKVPNIGTMYNVITIDCPNNSFAYVMGEMYDKKGKLIQSGTLDPTNFMEIAPGTSQSRYREIVCGDKPE